MIFEIMNISDNILKRRLENVCFLWGRGKTTVATLLRERLGDAAVIYSTDDSRWPHMCEAYPDEQPYMCRDYEAEYGVSFWELPKDVIAEREEHFLAEMTPFIIADLLTMAGKHKIIICEGDIDYGATAPIASHAVYLCNRSTGFDWFDRPDHADALDAIKNRTDLTDAEKQEKIDAAYAAVACDEETVPDWVTRNGIPVVVWDDTTTPEQTADEVAGIFFGKSHGVANYKQDQG